MARPIEDAMSLLMVINVSTFVRLFKDSPRRSLASPIDAEDVDTDKAKNGGTRISTLKPPWSFPSMKIQILWMWDWPLARQPLKRVIMLVDQIVLHEI